MTSIYEAFSLFCKERHAEDRGRNFNLLQTIYANTEFFDISLLEGDYPELLDLYKEGDDYASHFPVQDFSIPFANIFIKLKDDMYMFIREYSPDIITGAIYFTKNFDKQFKELGGINYPFIINLNSSVITSNFNSKIMKFDIIEKLAESTFKVVLKTCQTLNNLSKKAVVVDTPTSNHCTYYRRKKEPTIKVAQRPIYYVLEKKEETEKKSYNSIRPVGKLEFSHSFHVRGHWRHISEKSLGKDRNGEYIIKGFTWVTEYVKGEGELVKRLRVIK